MSTADAVAREAAWLQVSADSLPALLASAGGPWQVVQAYWPGPKFAAGKSGIYVQRRRFQVERFGGVRLMPHHAFLLKLVWPVKATAAGIAETEAQNFDSAIELLRQRVNGLPFDKTHGGRFRSAAETPPGTFFEVDYDDPEVTIPQGKWLRATATYLADDPEIIPA
jgi:hypothetical protein